MSICLTSCGLGSSNTGIPNGAKPFGVPVSIFVTPLYANDGTENEITLSGLDFDQAFLDGKINETDPSKRWYPIVGIENVASEKAENIVETFNSGNIQIVSEGVRNFAALLPSKPHEYLKQIKNLQCSRVGVYLIDSCGNFLGNNRVSTTLKPMRVAKNTWSAILAWATDTTGQNINLTFNLDKLERDEDAKMIVAQTITADLLGVNGLIDVAFIDESVSIANDTVTFTAQTLYGGVLNPITVEGLEIADFSVTVNGIAETIVSIAETDGTYVLTLTSNIVSTDVIVVNASKNGFEFTGFSITA